MRVFRTLLVAASLAACSCGSLIEVSAPSASPSPSASATAALSPVTFVEQPEMQAWVTVKSAIGSTAIVLRPTWLPDRFGAQSVMIEYAYVTGGEARYRVGYRSTDGLINVAAGAVNSGPPTATRAMTVHGQPGTYSTSSTWPERQVQWTENGTLYSVQARGLSEDELLRLVSGISTQP